MSTPTNRLQTAVLTVALCWCVAAQAYEFAGGTGEPNDPYQIATAEQLTSIGADPNLLDKHFVLLNDIDLDPNLPGGQVFTQALIAPDTNDAPGFQGTSFTGSCDGKGHVIRNLAMRGDTGRCLGLFGKVDRQGVVKDLGVEAASVRGLFIDHVGILAAWNDGRIIRCYADGHAEGWDSVGGLIGVNGGAVLYCHASGTVQGYVRVGGLVGGTGSRILNCHAACAVSVTASMGGLAGGLVGQNGGYVTNSYATGAVSSEHESQKLGGLVGLSSRGTITNCYATGNVFCTQECYSFGGLVGQIGMGLGGEARVCNCYAAGDVSGAGNSASLGGLVGYSLGHISRSYATGRISAGPNSRDLGGLVGRHDSNRVEASFWDVEASGLSVSAGGTGLTTARMLDETTFIAAGWDLVGERANGVNDTWRMLEAGGYPILALAGESYDPPRLAGTGTPDDPYRIATPEDLGAIWHYDPFASYELTADIDLSGITWGMPPVAEFSGTFKGAGFIISHLTIHGRDPLGLFGLLERGAIVRNLGVEDANITGGDRLTWPGTGILAGGNSGEIAACFATGRVSIGPGGAMLGGLVGYNDGSISNCYTEGDISLGPSGQWFGNLAGSNGGLILNSYASGTISSQGPKQYPTQLVGENSHGTITSSYFLAALVGGPGNATGFPLTNEQMRQEANFVGWDFEDVWTICEGRDYPRLRWEKINCSEP